MIDYYNSMGSFVKQKLFYTFFAFLFFLTSTKAISQTIVYSFENAQITTSGGDTFYEADIAITTDTDFKLGSGQFYLDYNTAAFGTNIFGANLTFDHPNGGAYVVDEKIFGGALDAYDLILANSTTSKLSIAYIPNVSGQVSTNITVANSPNLICHIKIRFDDVNEDPMITFDDQLPTSSQGLTHIDGTPEIQINTDTYDSSGAIIASVNTWTGATNTDWDTATNWSSGTVPTGTTDVHIPSGLGFPIASSNASVNELTIASGAGITVNGNLTNNGSTVISSGGSLIVTGTTSGLVTYKRTLSTTNWYLISSPFNGQSIVDFYNNNQLATGSGTGVSQNIALAPFDYDQVLVNNRWNYYTIGDVDGLNGDDTTNDLTRGKGYAVKLNSPGDITITGTMPSTGFVQIPVRVSGETPFNLIGNPYSSFLAANDQANSASNFLKTNGFAGRLEEATIWFWDQSANGGIGTYVTANQATSNLFISPGQGFFVKADANTNLTLGLGMFSIKETENFNRSVNTRPEIKLTVLDGNNTVSTDIFYINGTTTGFDNGYDSSLFGGIANEFAVYTHLVSDSQGQDLAIQSLPDSNFESMVIPVGVNAASGINLVFTAESTNIPNGLSVILEDREQGVYTNLSDSGAEYSVTLPNDSNGIGRFYLHTNNQSTLSTPSQELTNVSVYKTSTSNLRITGIDAGNVSMLLYNLLGQSVFTTSFEGSSVNDITLPSLKAGIYVIDVHTEKGKMNKKIIIE